MTPMLPSLLLTVSSLVPALRPFPLQSSDRLDAWREDLGHLIGEMERLHPDPYFGTPRADFEAAIDGVFAQLDTLSDEGVVLEIMRLVALISSEGRDGHSVVIPGADYHYMPVRVYGFADGWFVVSADGPLAERIGARVTGVGRVTIEEAMELLAPCLNKDNEHDLRARLPLGLVCTEMLHAVGISDDPLRVTLTLVGAHGQTSEVTVQGVDFPSWMAWGRFEMRLPARERGLIDEGSEQAYWYRELPEQRALYFQYNAVLSRDERGRGLGDFARELRDVYEEGEFDRLVIDLRKNPGGDNTTFGPLIEALKACDAAKGEGKLRALISRHTFSACGNFVTVLERETTAVLVGEPTGGAPNQYGDAQPVHLPNHSGIQVRISTVYHEFGGPDDSRLTHEPDLAVELTSEDYFAGRDPVLEAALADK